MKALLNRYRWLNAFYLLSAYIVYRSFDQLAENGARFESANWRFPLNLLTPSNFGIYETTGKTIFAGFLVLAAVPWKTSAWCGLLFWTVYLAQLHSFGVVGHDKHGFFLVGLGATVALAARQNHRNLDYGIAALVTMYTSSGLWKLLGLFHGDSIAYQAVNTLPFHMAYGLAENYSDRVNFFFQYFAKYPLLSVPLWLLTVFGEILIPVLTIRARTPSVQAVCLFVFVAFHIGAYIMVGPKFTSQVYLLIFLAAAVYSKSFLNGSSANSMKAETFSGV